jgi:signal transduction histidine kinase
MAGRDAGPRPLDRGSVAGRAVLGRATIHLHDYAAAPEGEYPLGRELQRRFGYRTAAATPMVHGETVIGAIGIARTDVRPFTARELQLLETFAAQAAIALELAERRRDAERLVVLEDRDRIAKDLHDTVIQRLFAIAMTLMSAIKITQKRDVAVRVQRAVDDLDDTIRQVRSTVFALQATGDDEPTLRRRLFGVVDDAAESLGFAPSVRLDGLLDTLVDEGTGEHLIAVLREALSNAARHARATHVDVSVVVGADLLLCVADDGVGVPATGRRSGLANMASRAESLGGEFEVRPGETGGTILEWRVPLRPDDS